MDTLPLGILFLIFTIGIAISIEIGYRFGHFFSQKSENEKESPVSAISSIILGLLAFILAFTFGFVTNRYDARRDLVRQEANAISTAWLRADFMQEPDRSNSKELFVKYIDVRINVIKLHDPIQTPKLLEESNEIQRQLWDMAVSNARKDMNSDVAALYIESVNEVIDLQALRIAIGLQTRIPSGIWYVLLILILLGMMSVGYQTAIAGSKRTWAVLILILSFSLVITMIATLDRPYSSFIPVSQQPLENARSSMTTGTEVQ